MINFCLKLYKNEFIVLEYILVKGEEVMKKNIKMVLALFSSLSIALSGCSLARTQTPEATEYLSDKESEEEVTVEEEEAASSEDSIVVINNLFEPVLEELEHEDEILAQKAEEEKEKEQEEKAQEEKEKEASEEEEEFRHINIVFFGDSQIANGRSDGSDIPSILTTRVPNCTVYNLAIGGTTASVEKSTSSVNPEELRSTSFLGMTYCLAGKSDRNETLAENNRTVLETMNKVNPEEVDFYVIEYGANDFFNGVTLDTQEYDQAKKAHAFYNSMCMGIDVLRSISPKAEFFVMSPFYGIYVNDDGSYVGDSYIVSNGIGTLADYAKKAKNVTEDTGTTFIDCMFISRCDLYLDTASEYLSDNIHLTLLGRQIFTRLLAHNINFAMKYEPYAYLDTDFIKIAEYDTEETYRYREDLMEAYYPESWEKYIKGEFPLAQPSEEALAKYNAEHDNDG